MENSIIVIDDSRSIREYAMDVLSNSGFTVFGACDGPGGLDLIDKHEPDVVLLDIIMPGISGLDVLRILREKKIILSILLFTTRSSVSQRVEGLKAGADDYIAKPFEDEELIARVGSAARRIALEKNLAKLVDVKTRRLVRKEQQALYGQIVQGIVHNLNNPLMAVSGFAEIAKMKLLEFIKSSENRIDEDQTLLLKNIIKTVEKGSSAADKTKSLINTLLNKSRHESIEQKQKINLNKLIKQEIDFFKAYSKLKNAIKITLDLDQANPEIFGTYTDFSQVGSNLIGNAADAMINSSKKELAISTKHDNENIYILIKDTGEGISPVNLKRIFDPFFTTKVCKDEEKGEKAGGTGLGLHTCKQLLKTYGSDISVKSDPGAGAAFKITIPRINIFKTT
ncbi:MAG: hybrid sensor histidine kinase/response regulator [Deltaproteobacteria bacterium]|nr:hybrid sensor histidine kinase/response regulator [Deltaproteobacteria bacterium]